MIMTTATELAMTTLGTWQHRELGYRLTACYFDADGVLIDNSAGESFVLSVREWLSRWDSLRDSGWTRA